MTRYLFVLIAGLFFLGIATAEAEMYKWVDENGVVHFSDSPVQKRLKRKGHGDGRECWQLGQPALPFQ